MKLVILNDRTFKNDYLVYYNDGLIYIIFDDGMCSSFSGDTLNLLTTELL